MNLSKTFLLLLCFICIKYEANVVATSFNEHTALSKNTIKITHPQNHDVVMYHDVNMMNSQNQMNTIVQSDFGNLPEPAIIVILNMGDRHTYKINRRFFKIGTGYDSSNLDEINKLGWPTEFRYSNIVHHFFEVIKPLKFCKDCELLKKIPSTPSFILSSTLHTVINLPLQYWKILLSTNVRILDLMYLDFGRNNIDAKSKIYALKLAETLSKSQVKVFLMGSRMLNEDGVLTFLEHLELHKLENFVIQNLDVSQDNSFKILVEMNRLGIKNFNIGTNPIKFVKGNSCLVNSCSVSEIANCQDDGNTYLSAGLTDSNIYKLSQSEIASLLRRFVEMDVKELSFNRLNFQSSPNFAPLLQNLKLETFKIMDCQFTNTGNLALDFFKNLNFETLNSIDFVLDFSNIETYYDIFRFLSQSPVKHIKFEVDNTIIDHRAIKVIAKLFKLTPEKIVNLVYYASSESHQDSEQIKSYIAKKCPNIKINILRYYNFS